MNTAKDKLVCTGERVIEGDYKTSASRYLIYLFHVATYKFCLPYLRQKKVLDFGCGSGYGTHFVSSECQHITGIDISAGAIEYARQNYSNENLEYLKINNIESEPLPFKDNEFDVVISFQVMEHICQVDKYLSEIRRVLRGGGTLIIATPDRTSRLFPGQRPWNVYHVTEYSPEAFYSIVARKFPNVELYGMSGTKRVIDIELKRTRRLRLATYIFTFPFCPEWYREASLRLLKFSTRLLSSLINKGKNTVNDTNDVIDCTYGFTVDDVVIEKNLETSVNIISVATNTK